MKIIGRPFGFHSTPGIWWAIFGLPGVVAGSWIQEFTGSDTGSYIVMFLMNWIFWLGIIKAAEVLKRKLSH
jgi:hypothetical protein